MRLPKNGRSRLEYSQSFAVVLPFFAYTCAVIAKLYQATHNVHLKPACLKTAATSGMRHVAGSASGAWPGLRRL
jgi:hypothetical protein